MTPRRRAAVRRLPSTSARIAAAAQLACLLEVIAPKPGNVGRGHDLPGLTYRDFVLSATAIGPVFRRRLRGRVGRLILEAVGATRRQVGTNTNLGMILLLAPLAKAAVLAGRGSARPAARGTAPTVTTGGGTPITAATLRRSLARVLRRLDRRDARDAYRAIRLARPGGLGRVRAQDIASPPTRSLLECMRLASAHDAIAREYATDYAVTFDTALPALRRLRAARVPAAASIAQTYLELLASRPDSLITRRHGAAAALRVSREAKRVIGAGGLAAARGRRLAARLDRRLRAARPPLNPGATADLTVAALFAWLLLRSSGSRSPRRGSSRAPR